MVLMALKPVPLFVVLIAMLKGINGQLSVIATGIPQIVSLLENVTETSTKMASMLPYVASSLKNQEDLLMAANLLLRNNTVAAEILPEVGKQIVSLLHFQQGNQNQTEIMGEIFAEMAHAYMQMTNTQAAMAENLNQMSGHLQGKTLMLL